MKIFLICLLTLVIYSAITTTVIVISHGNETIIEACGLGIVGCLLKEICSLFYKIRNFFTYHYKKRSIFEKRSDGKRYICSVKDCNAVNALEEYHLVKRYAPKSEWIDLPELSEDVLQEAKRNYC